jgi:hypothetical protein
MINAMHGMFYSSAPDELRAFLRDKLQLGARDVGGGWLIFDLPAADLGVHPTDFEGSPPSGTHQVSFVTDDIETTVAGMRERGVTFSDDIADRGYGHCIHFEMPGGIKVELYQKKY